MSACENCKKEHNGSYGSGRFCSEHCAKSINVKGRVIKKHEIENNIFRPTTLNKICINCGNSFVISWKKRNQLTCSRSCSISFRMKNGQASKMGRSSVIVQSEKRRSKNEIYFAELCRQQFSNILTNEQIFNGWDADIILKDLKIAVLWNGKWHYEKLTKKHSIQQVQNRDKIKIKEIKNAGYFPYIIKDMGKYNKEFVEKQFQLLKIYAGWTGDSSSSGS